MLPEGLKELNLSNCLKIKAKEFQKLNSFSKLEKLNVANTQIEKLDMLPKNLKEIDLRGCDLTAQTVQALTSFDKLQVILLPSEFENFHKARNER